MHKLLVAATVFALLATGCGRQVSLQSKNSSPNFMPKERVSFQTSDDVAIIGDYLTVKHAKGYVLLLHMMPATRESWYPFMDQLAAAGFASLAIDLRGHGESTVQNEKRLNYQKFSDEQHQASIKDVEAALQWLKRKGTPSSKIMLVGASIGANLALQYLAEHSEIHAAALLSPGLDYRGIRTESFAKEVLQSQAVYLAASRDDSYSFNSDQVLFPLLQSNKKELKELEGAGHGTEMFEREPRLMEEVIAWLSSV